jgi:protein TonB
MTRIWPLVIVGFLLVLPPAVLCQRIAGQSAATTSAPPGAPHRPPIAVYAPDPEFPEQARKEHRNQSILLQLTVGADGLPRDIKVVRSLTPELDGAATAAVKKWKFAPATKDGRLVKATITVEIPTLP